MIYNLALLLPCAICLFGAAWLICKRENGTLSQTILAAGFFISALFFLCTANYVSGSINSTTYITYMWWDIIDSFATMLTIPTMYLYFRSITDEGKFTWKEYIWFIPALAVGIGTTGPYMIIDKAELEGYIQSMLIEGQKDSDYTDTIYTLHRFIGFEIYHLTAFFQLAGTSIFAVLGLRKYHQRLREFYSDADDKSADTDNKILYWFLLNIPLSLALIVPDIRFWEKHPFLSSLLFITWAVIYFALFYYGSQKKYTVDNFVQDLQQADLEEQSYREAMAETFEMENTDNLEMADRQISPKVFQRLGILFTKLIDEDKIYLENDLRLDKVARLMSTNRAYVSKVIKETYHCSFSDYVNGKRIDFSMELMRSDPHLTQDKIAEQSGFINAQSYSRTFKKMIGIPPKEWLNRNIHHS